MLSPRRAPPRRPIAAPGHPAQRSPRPTARRSSARSAPATRPAAQRGRQQLSPHYPDGTFEKTVFNPWESASYDRNDTVLDSDWYATASTLERDKSAAHADTPSQAFFDVLGRPYYSRADAGTSAPVRYLDTHSKLDIAGQPLIITDARDIPVQATHYDMLGQALQSTSSDAGARRGFSTIDGQPWRAWDARGHAARWEYDDGRRLTHAYVTGLDSTERVRQRMVYGDGATSPAANNLRGRLHSVYDGAGLIKTPAYDFLGRPDETIRRLTATHVGEPDWSTLSSSADPTAVETSAAALLLTELMITSASLDALSRPLWTKAPNNGKTYYGYDAGGMLQTVDVDFDGSGTPVPMLKEVGYDALGRRTHVRYAREDNDSGIGDEDDTDGLLTTYTYDPLSYRLTKLETHKSVGAGGTALQDYSYTYDAVGNVVYIDDDAVETVYFSNTAVDAHREFTYDAIYRLTAATGREGLSVSGASTEASPAWQGLPDPRSTEAVQRYNQSYTYDEVGSLTALNHSAGVGDSTENIWSRSFTMGAANNQLASTQYTGLPSPYYFSYDAHGNMREMSHMTSTIDDDGMQWGEGDRLIRTRHGSGAGAYYTRYQYDGGGQRVRKVVEHVGGATYKETVYVGGYERFRQHNTDGSLHHEEQTLHVSDGKRRFALIEVTNDTAVPLQYRGPVMRLQLVDHLGSGSVEVGGSEELLTFEEYYPYGSTSHRGKSSSDVGWSRKRYRFTGQERDEESGLSYHHNRYYAAWLGRWTRSDPAGLQGGVNSYRYAGANPVGRVDPSGLRDETGNAPSIRRLFGIAPDQQDAAFRKNAGALAQAKMSLAIAGYGLLNVATGGFVSKHDESFEAYTAGEISGSDYSVRTGVDAGFSLATTAGGGVVGGKVGGYVASRGGSAVAAGFVGGAVEGAATNVVEQSLAIATDQQGGFEVGQLVMAAGSGGAFGAAGGYSASQRGGAATDVPGPRPRANPDGDSMAGGEFIGAQPNRVAEPEPPLASGGGDGARFIGQPDGKLVDTNATPRGSFDQPNGGRTDTLQAEDHGAGLSHTHDPIVNTNPKTGEAFINGRQQPGRPVSAEDVENIVSGAADPSRPKGR